MEKFSKRDQKQKTSMTNTQSHLKDAVMCLGIFLKEGLHVLTKLFCIFYVQVMKTAVGLRERTNLDDGEKMQIPCILHFFGEVKCISKLKDILPQLMYKSSTCLHFSSRL